MHTRLARTLATCGCAVALCLGLAACGGTSATPTNGGITVNATSKVSVVPDVCSFTATVTVRDSDAAAAQRAAAKPVKALIKQMKKLGIDEKDIQTLWTDVSPTWDENGEVDGYESRTVMQFDNVPVEQAGDFMQAALDAGATETGSLSYSSSAYEDSYQQALAQAIEASRPKAEAIAQASGVSLGKVVAVTEGYQDMSFAADTGMATAATEDSLEEKSIDIAPGEVDIEAQVTVTYTIN